MNSNCQHEMEIKNQELILHKYIYMYVRIYFNVCIYICAALTTCSNSGMTARQHHYQTGYKHTYVHMYICPNITFALKQILDTVTLLTVLYLIIFSIILLQLYCSSHGCKLTCHYRKRHIRQADFLNS